MHSLRSYCNRVRRTSIEVLRDFASAKGEVQTEYLFDMFRPMQVGEFSCGCLFLRPFVLNFDGTEREREREKEETERERERERMVTPICV